MSYKELGLEVPREDSPKDPEKGTGDHAGTPDPCSSEHGAWDSSTSNIWELVKSAGSQTPS